MAATKTAAPAEPETEVEDAPKPIPTAARGQHSSIADTSRGLVSDAPAILSEDQKRALGVDAGQGAEPGVPSARRGTGGGVLDAYANSTQVEHPNMAGPAPELVVGQAPHAPARPMRNSPAAKEKFDPEVPNSINRSPVIRGFNEDGSKTEAPDFNDLRQGTTDAEGADTTEQTRAKVAEPLVLK